MTIKEQQKIAYDQGRLAAWCGRAHHGPMRTLPADLYSAWKSGVEAQAKRMTEEIEKTPLTWSDQNKPGARAD